MLARHHHTVKAWYECYVSCSMGLSFLDAHESVLAHLPEYEGIHGLLLLKAVSGVHWEKVRESVSIYECLLGDENCPPHIAKKAEENLPGLEKGLLKVNPF